MPITELQARTVNEYYGVGAKYKNCRQIADERGTTPQAISYLLNKGLSKLPPEAVRELKRHRRLQIEPPRASAWDAFWSRVHLSLDGCWEWTGKSVGVGAHRLLYEYVYGPLATGLFVCHKCDNPCCVRPDHLFAGTAQDNALDRDFKGRRSWRDPNYVARGRKHGLASTYVNYSCRCRACQDAHNEYYREYNREWRERRQGAVLAFSSSD